MLRKIEFEVKFARIIFSLNFTLIMKKRRRCSSGASRAGFVQEPPRSKKFLADVLLVCELLLFITLATLQGKKTSAPLQDRQSTRPRTVRI